MKTETLIGQLAARQLPASALPKSGRLVLLVLLVTLTWICSLITMLGVRENVFGAMQTWQFLLGSVLLGVGGITALQAAHKTLHPDVSSEYSYRICMVISAGWLCLLLFSFVTTSNAAAEVFGSPNCFIVLFIFAIGPLALFMYFVLRGFPLQCGKTMALAGTGAACFGALGLQFVCGNDHALHHLLFHFAPAFLLTAVAWTLGRSLLSWDRRVIRLKERLNEQTAAVRKPK